MGEQASDSKDSYSVTTKPSRGASSGPLPKMPSMPKLRRPKSSFQIGAIGLVVGAVLLSLTSGATGAWMVQHNDQSITGTSLTRQKKIVTSQSQLISQIAKTVGPSVVSVNVNITSTNAGQDSFSSLFGLTEPDNMQAAGTGIIISTNGLIVTNRHVVPQGTTSVSVTLSDGTELKNVSVVGRTNNSDSLDVAFLKINDTSGHKLTPAVIGDSSSVQVGDNVVAIGNALGQFQNTVTSGIISGYGRSVQASDSSGSSANAESLDDLFQTDAAINEGNSGGPLVNLNGQVIGINTAIAGNAQNIGFAIPINNLRGMIDQVVKNGTVSRPYIGVRYLPVTADVATQFNLSVEKGAYIPESKDPNSPAIGKGTPAEKAGLKAKDVIMTVDGVAIDQSHSLTSLLGKHQPGDTVILSVLRGDDTVEIKVTLGSMPKSQQ